MFPLVSIIIPCYNQALFLEEAVDSVLNCTYPNFEIIIVDDGSHDHSAKIALKIHEKYPEIIHVIMQENAGPSKARNVGVKAARGKYILPLDGDDKISKDYIKEAIDIFEKNNDVKVVYCEAEKFGNESGHLKLKTFSKKALAMDNMIFVSALYKKTDWKKCGGYDTQMTWGSEDWEFWINMLKSGGEVVKLPITGFYYRVREGSRRKVTDKESTQKTVDLINEKHIDFLKEQIGGPLRNPRSWSEVINKVSGWF